MIDVSTTHPFEACAAFAVRWLARLAGYDRAGAEALIDINDPDADFAQSVPPPQGFTYGHPDGVRAWTMYVLAADERGLRCDFEVPFAEPEFLPAMARFHMRRLDTRLQVRFPGLVPS